MADQLVSVGGRRLRVSNLDKVMYPDSGTTKGEVIDYYSRIAGVMIPHVTGRPATRKRWVHGVGETAFFAKDIGEGAPEWVHRATIAHSDHDNTYPLIDELPTLVWLAQTAALEIHVPQWRFTPDTTRGTPDRLVLDLDPGEGVGLAECAEVARRARGILQGMGLEPVPVTSGSKGLHLYAPLDGSLDSDQASAVARELARALEADDAELVVSRMAKALRPGRVFVDWSQNSASKTTIAPYSLRGRERPTVAAPRSWAELDDPGLAQLEFDEVLARVEAEGDPMAALGFHAGARADSGEGPLAAYRSKRTAGKTPEPVPDSPSPGPASAQPRFVIQEHHARRLHWDFRLERGGVLVSWAVPKGIPADAAVNHLAVQTEDHPLEYGEFEGTIPAGEYGAGDVTIWDDGRYTLEKWRDDEVIVTVTGRPGGPLGRVRLALIRTSGEGEKSQWLMHRMKAQPASPASPTPHPAPAPASAPAPAPTGLGAVRPGIGESNRAELPANRSGTAEGAGQGGAREETRRYRPMLASPATPGELRGHDWSIEMKWDGIRALAVIGGERLRLVTRSGTEVAARYPELHALAEQLDASSAVLDGEIVALDPRGRPRFGLLQPRMNLTKEREIARQVPRTTLRYYVFDLLELDGVPLIDEPLAERRERLERLLAASATALVPPAFGGDVDAALAASRQLGLEGIVAKDPRSRYRAGARTREWLKLRFSRTQEVVIGGYRPGQGARRGRIGSLLMGVPGDDGLEYVGRVGTGFTDRELDRLGDRLRRLERATSPFVAVPDREASDAVWLTPSTVGEVEYAEWTAGGNLRHPSWRGLRPDKSPSEVVREG